jgi:hypothetical protein
MFIPMPFLDVTVSKITDHLDISVKSSVYLEDIFPINWQLIFAQLKATQEILARLRYALERAKVTQK